MTLVSSVLENFKAKATGTLVIIVLYFVAYAVRNIYFHPLSKYPGPKLWAATRFRYLLSIWSGNLHTDVQQLHQRYGEIVRVAPDEISFARPDAWHDVYSNAPGHPAFPKSKLWHGQAPGRPMSILNALDRNSHSRFRRAMEPGFTERALRFQEPLIQTYTDMLITALDKFVSQSSDGAVINVVQWFGFTIFDLIGDLAFGESFECLGNSKFHPWVALIFNSLKAATLAASLRYYPSIDWLLRLAIPKSVMQKQKEHWQLAVDKVNRRLNTEKERPDIISMIKLDENRVDGISIPELQATASVIIVAGSETTVSVLTGMTNYLVRNPKVLARLTAEIRSTFKLEKDMSLSALKEVPYLNAVIQEGLRLCNPTPVGLPRIVPPGGGTVCGHQLPEGTFVNVHPLALSRSPEMFHDPHGFHPERWLNIDPRFSGDKHEAVQTFGVGPRSCIGKPLAWAEMRLVLARMVWRFELQMADTEAGRVEWDDQKVFSVVQRKPFEVRLNLREGVPSIS